MDSGRRRKRGRSLSASRSASPGFKRRNSPDRRARSPDRRHGREIDAFGRQTDREPRGGRHDWSPPRRRRRSRSRGSPSPDRRERSPRRRDRSPPRGKGGGKGGGKGSELSLEVRVQSEAKSFFDEHKEEEWFVERYDPNLVQAQRAQLIERAQGEAEKFATQLEAGGLAPCYDFVKQRTNKESKNKADDAGEEEGETEPDKSPAESAAQKGSKGEDAEGAAAEAEAADVSSTTIFIKAVHPKWKRAELEELLQPGTLKFSEPIASKDWCRTGWANYDTPQQCAEAYERCKSSSIGEKQLELALTPANRILHNAPIRSKILTRAFADERRVTHDLEQAKLLVQHLDLEKGLVPNEVLTSDGDTPAAALDLVILYLRQVHLFDYYAGDEFVEMAALERRAPAAPLRGLAPEREVEHRNISKQEITLDTKIRHRLQCKWAIDERAAGGKLDDWDKKFLEEHTIKESEGKFGCTFSEKKFMGPEFVHKHILNKHAAKMADAKAQAYERIYFDSYKNDPVRPRNPTTGPAHFGQMQGGGGYGFGKGGYGGGKGFKGDGFGWGKGGFKGKGKGFGDHERFRGGRSPPFRRGRSPPRGGHRGGGGLGRAMRSYNDLDAAEDVVAPIDFDELDALESQLGGLSDNEKEEKKEESTKVDEKSD